MFSAPAPIIEQVGRSDSPPPSSRTLEEAKALLDEIDLGAREIFLRHGLPADRGLYRHDAHGDEWVLVPDEVSAAARWHAVLERPTEAGFRYLSLADLGRYLCPQDSAVQSAATVMDRAGDVRRLLEDSGEDDLRETLLMFWTAIALLAPFLRE